MRIPLTKPYNGLTIIMSSPSRFDIKHNTLLFSIPDSWARGHSAGHWFKEICIPEAGLDYRGCDIFTLDEYRKPLDGTKGILCLGVKAQNLILGTKSTLGEQRGSPIMLPNGIIGMSSYSPQDCFDRENYEQLDDSDSEIRRPNYKFWLQHDVAKLARIMRQGVKYDESPIIITRDAVELLFKHEGELFLDIETAFKVDNSVRCFAFCRMEGPIYVVPLMNYKDEPCHDFFRILLTLCLAIRRSPRVITHNGAVFDHLILSWRYKLPMFNWNMYDTLIAQHRCYQKLEKSLGHCISMWTDDPYHKDEGTYEPHNFEEDNQLFTYCGKDVRGLRAVYKAQCAYISKDPGLQNSVDIAQEAANAYFEPMLTGHHIDDVVRLVKMEKLRNRCDLLIRITELLIGEDLKSVLTTTKKPSPMISSRDQLTKYVHEYKGVKPVALTPKGEPKLGELEIYKILNTGFKDPIFRLVIPFRETQTACGALDIGNWYRNYGDWRRANNV